MRVLNIEDADYKHDGICEALNERGITDIDWAKNLADGLDMLQTAADESKNYDLVITDMYYPLKNGEKDVEAGKVCVKKMKEMGLDTPVILCSSVQCYVSGILGMVCYDFGNEWKNTLNFLLDQLE